MSVEPVIAEPTTLPAELPVVRRRGSALAWAAIACVLLGASGAARTVQERRHKFERAHKDTCPIDLKKIPDLIGTDWKVIKGTDRTLDEYTMKITGGTDHVIKTYANEATGVIVTILVLFGPAEPVLPHTPQVCYPASGFQQGEAPTGRAIVYTAGKDDRGRPIDRKADFLSASYIKPNGRQVIREAVYHSYRLDGRWSSSIGEGRKFPRRNPGIFKVQIQRLIADGEKLGPNDPLEQFLGAFLSEVEGQIEAAEATKPAVAAG